MPARHPRRREDGSSRKSSRRHFSASLASGRMHQTALAPCPPSLADSRTIPPSLSIARRLRFDGSHVALASSAASGVSNAIPRAGWRRDAQRETRRESLRFGNRSQPSSCRSTHPSLSDAPAASTTTLIFFFLCFIFSSFFSVRDRSRLDLAGLASLRRGLGHRVERTRRGVPRAF